MLCVCVCIEYIRRMCIILNNTGMPLRYIMTDVDFEQTQRERELLRSIGRSTFQVKKMPERREVVVAETLYAFGGGGEKKKR